VIKKWQWRRACYRKHHPLLHSLLVTNIPAHIIFCRVINFHDQLLSNSLFILILLFTGCCSLCNDMCCYWVMMHCWFCLLHFVHTYCSLQLCLLMNHQWCGSNEGVGMRLLGGPTSAPSKVVLTGPLVMSTVSHFCFQRELQPCICAVSRWSVGSMLPHKYRPTPHMSGAHQHAITLWQCWQCCSDAELICSSSCTCSISIPNRMNVIVLSPRVDVYLDVFFLPMCVLKESNWHLKNVSAHQILSLPKYRKLSKSGPYRCLTSKLVRRFDQTWRLGAKYIYQTTTTNCSLWAAKIYLLGKIPEIVVHKTG